MVFVATFAVMLVISISTVQGAPTKRQNSADKDEKLESLIRGVLFLGSLAPGSTVRVSQNNIILSDCIYNRW